jgi:hypothetical protein
MRFSSHFSILTMRISTGWSTRLSLLKTRSMRWRRMARGKCHFWDSPQEATLGLACLSQGLSSETEYGSSVDAWTTSSIPDAVTELLGVASKLPDAEASATGSLAQCAATVLPEHISRPLSNCSNLVECASSRKL